MPSQSDKISTNTLPTGLGEGTGWSRDRLVLQTYSHDLWPRKLLELRERGPAEPTVDLVVWPETPSQVQALVRWADTADVDLIPYGAGSGVCGATIPSGSMPRPRVMVDLKRLKRVRSLDRESMTVWAEAGIIGENLERHLNQEGLTLGHFPSSIYCSSLGGYLATRSAGQLSTKYGKIEDMVLALETVLPNGELVITGRAPRSAMGPDWTQLLLGSEGTLGVFTAACLQVHPLPEHREFLGFGTADVNQAMAFTRTLMQQGIRPAVMRIYDKIETSLTIPSERLGTGFSGGCAIVTVFEGTQAMAAVEASEARRIADSMEVSYLGPTLGTHWWEHRYDVSYKQQLILSHDRLMLDTFEIAATWDRLSHVYEAVKGVNLGFGVMLAHFSHFYHTGANIYFTLASHSGLKASTVEHYDQVWESILGAAMEAGATLSHHHGVGVQKSAWLPKEKGAFIQIYEKVKRGFDPQNRFNPGKMGL
ncbi:MAG: FAD-binding oxidoreductase [Bdellovibrionales bacterium]|nr:FAD-binding oxidoreductase [Bdellovibrionales bacterium]